MKKRIMSMLLVLLMAISLLPAAALATDSEPAPTETDSLYLGKSYDPATGKLTLETYAKGETVVVEKTQPCDIVLVLDVSGSMGNERNNNPWIKVGNISDNDMSQLDPVHGATAGVYRVNQRVFGERDMRYYNGHWQYDSFGIGTNWKNIEDVWFSNLFSLNDVEIKKIDALKIAATGFIDEVQKNAEKNNVDHKISIVKFAGTKTDVVGDNYYNGNTYNYSQVVTNLTSAKTTADAQNLKAKVDALGYGGATHADYGMEHAKSILTAANDPNRSKVVVLFTDGEPGETGFDDDVADNTVLASKALKDMGTVVYSVGVFDDGVQTKVHRYMNAVSTNHKDATAYSEGGTAPHDYYMTASTATGLEDIFKSIAEEIGGSLVELNEQSTVVDQMSSYFKLDGVSAADPSKVEVYTADCTDEDENGFVFSSTLVPFTGAKITVTDGDTVNVSGFDFSENWVGKDGSGNYHGKKLVVKFPVQPKADAEGKVPTNSSASGVYDKDGKLVAEYPVPQYTPATVSRVIDFNAKVNLANGVSQLGEQTLKNGEFTLESGVLAYQFTPVNLASGAASLVMDGVDSAMTFTSNVWTKYNAIPANNIYFDDDLVDHDALTYDDGSGYNADVRSDVSTDAGVINANGEKLLFFTFTGTGIDVYCTTDKAGGYVQAAIFNGTVNADTPNLKDQLVAGQDRIAVRNYAITTRYNTPTVSYTGLPHGTYTLYVRAMTGSNYKLDGVRIYNPMADQSVYDNNKQEQNAQFANLRDSLVNGETDVVAFVDPTAGTLTDQAANAINDILFIDDANSPNLKRAVSGEAVYENAFKAYEANGPKTEIYLAKDQAIVFNIADADQYDHFWLGIRAPEDGVGKVTVNSKEIVVGSAVDMYYDITVGTDGNVTITNTEDCMIALTNLKVTSENNAKALSFGSVSPQMLKAVSDQAAASAAGQTTQDDADTTMSRLVRQILSSFIQQLFGSISRMFGK